MPILRNVVWAAFIVACGLGGGLLLAGAAATLYVLEGLPDDPQDQDSF